MVPGSNPGRPITQTLLALIEGITSLPFSSKSRAITSSITLRLLALDCSGRTELDMILFHRNLHFRVRRGRHKGQRRRRSGAERLLQAYQANHRQGGKERVGNQSGNFKGTVGSYFCLRGSSSRRSKRDDWADMTL